MYKIICMTYAPTDKNQQAKKGIRIEKDKIFADDMILYRKP